MNKEIFYLLIIILCIACCQCSKTVNTPPITTDCIDPTKIDPDAGCYTVYEPVCGCDGKTYGNACEADKNGVLVYTPGECATSSDKKNSRPSNRACIDPTKIAPDAGCFTVYEPVCGCDGKTYSNACEADRNGLLSYTPGECK